MHIFVRFAFPAKVQIAAVQSGMIDFSYYRSYVIAEINESKSMNIVACIRTLPPPNPRDWDRRILPNNLHFPLLRFKREAHCFSLVPRCLFILPFTYVHNCNERCTRIADPCSKFQKVKRLQLLRRTGFVFYPRFI